jgi:hypothetical protein
MTGFIQSNQATTSGSAAVELLRPSAQTEIVAHAAILAGDTLESELDQRYLALGDDRVLELHENPAVRYNLADFSLEMPAWNIRISVEDLPQVPRLMSREFMRLLHRAETNTMTDEEKKRWLTISDQVNYDRFSQERAAPRYIEGVLVVRKDSKCYVEWHDGKREWIAANVAEPLMLMEPAERFGAFVKFASNGAVSHIERLSFIGTGELEAEQVWAEWPPPISS